MHGLDSTRKLHLSRMIQGVADMAREIFRISQELVPVDTSLLKTSGTWRPAEGRFTKDVGVTYVVGYGILHPVFYAVYVHEMTHLHHEPPTGAKYLSRAVEQVINSGFGRFRGEYQTGYYTEATGVNGLQNYVGGPGF